MHLAEAFSFSALRRRRCFVTPFHTPEINTKLTRQVGVPLDRFKAYLRFLIDSAGADGRINAILWSTTERYVRWIHSVDDLTHELGHGRVHVASDDPATDAPTPQAVARVPLKIPKNFDLHMARAERKSLTPFPDMNKGPSPSPKR